MFEAYYPSTLEAFFNYSSVFSCDHSMNHIIECEPYDSEVWEDEAHSYIFI